MPAQQEVASDCPAIIPEGIRIVSRPVGEID